MSDNLTIFGIDYTGVTGVKVRETNGDYLTYVRPTGTKSIIANGTGIDVASYASVDVAVPSSGGNDVLVVTLSHNESTEMWEPDKTFAEIKAAHEAGKTFAVEATPKENEDTPAVTGEWTQIGGGVFAYTVDELHSSSVSGDFDGTIHKVYFSTTNGIVNQPNQNLWLTEDATATPSDVLSGKVFYNADGQQTGTATTPTPTLQSKTATPTEQQQTVSPDSGYDGLSSVTVGAIPSTYVGSGVTQRDSSDLTASGATVTVPAGHYAQQASKAVASGTEGTPTATKGSVSNHAVTVTPSVTNSAGYIAGGTHGGTGVTVAASELVSGTKAITGAGTTDVTEYASASVASGGATASATKGSVSNHSVTVTPKVTRTAGWVSAGTSNGTAVTVSASELVSGSQTITENGTVDVTNLASVTVALDFVTYHTSTSAPTSSQGSDGDIWLVTS